LSEEALAEVCMTGVRPQHLDRCDVCDARAIEIGRWLDEVRALGTEEAEQAFPAERLAAQQTQILRRLEQLDRPARVIAFPGQSRYRSLAEGAHGIRPAWVGFAAAAGLILGLVGGQVSARLTAPPPRVVLVAPTPTEQSAAVSTIDSSAISPVDLDESDRPSFEALEAIEQLTPHLAPVSEHIILRRERK
jgi:hypothetical protein